MENLHWNQLDNILVIKIFYIENKLILNTIM